MVADASKSVEDNSFVMELGIEHEEEVVFNLSLQEKLNRVIGNGFYFSKYLQPL